MSSRWYIYTDTNPHEIGYEGELLPDLLLYNEGLITEVNAWLQPPEIGCRLEVEPLASQLNELF